MGKSPHFKKRNLFEGGVRELLGCADLLTSQLLLERCGILVPQPELFLAVTLEAVGMGELVALLRKGSGYPGL